MQPGRCASRAICEPVHVLVFFLRDEAGIQGVIEVILRLHQRRPRELQIPGEVARSEAAESFGDRPRCAAR